MVIRINENNQETIKRIISKFFKYHTANRNSDTDNTFGLVTSSLFKTVFEQQ